MASNMPYTIYNCDYYHAWKTMPKCVSCSAPFSTTNRGITPNGKPILSIGFYRRPHNLPCFHVACEQCFYSNKIITCKECKTTTSIEKKGIFRFHHEMNLHLYGYCNYMQWMFEYDKQFLQTILFGSLKEDKQENQVECSECSTESTNKLCVQCHAAYCDKCFQRIHSVAKALKRHTLTPILKQRLIENKPNAATCCAKHELEFNYYCSDCDVEICQQCKSHHAEHTITTLIIKNRQLLPKLKATLDTVREATVCINQSKQDLQYMIEKYEEHASETVDRIAAYYVRLHGLLQHIEKKSMEQLKQNAIAYVNNIKDIRTTLKASEDKLEEVSKELNNHAKNIPKHQNLMSVIDDAKDMLKSTPLKIKFENTDQNPIQFQDNFQAIRSEIESIAEIKFKPNSFVPILTTVSGNQEFDCKMDYAGQNGNFEGVIKKSNSVNNRLHSNNFYIQPGFGHENNYFKSKKTTVRNPTFDLTAAKIKDQPKNDMNKDLMKSSMKSVLSSSVDSHYQYSSSYSLNSVPQDSTPITTSIVTVSHIKNPSHFYIQYPTFVKSSTNFLKCCKDESQYAAKADCIKLNKVYLVNVPNEKSWYRCKTLSKINDEIYRIIFIDYGRQENVPISRLREISEDLGSRKAGATLCSIYNVEPKDHKWSDDASQLMAEIIAEQPVTMIVYNDCEQTLVDLVSTSAPYPTSVRDALLFLNFATPILASSSQMSKKNKQISDIKEKLYQNKKKNFFKNTFGREESFKIKVVNIVSLSEFYIIKYDHIQLNKELNKKLNEACHKNSRKIYAPRSKMICCVYSEGSWFRGRIVNVLAKGFCDVWLVDVGTMLQTSWTYLRMIEDEFVTLNEGVTMCSLAQIEPLKENNFKWTEEAIMEFKRYAQIADIKISIVDMIENRCYDVMLYVNPLKTNVCLNEIMIKHNHASGIGGFMSRPAIQMKIVDVSDVEEEENSSYEDECFSITSKKRNNPIADTPIANSERKTKISLRTKVIVTRVVSPGEFYVSLQKHVSPISKMQNAIQDKMSEYMFEPNTWTLQDNCFVNAKKSNTSHKEWFRGTITMIINDRFLVFLRDFGDVVDVAAGDLAKIEPIFDCINNGVIRCHLACVQPTGGLTAWTSTAKDEFNMLIKKFEQVGVSIQGDRKDDSISCILWGLTIGRSDPLAPSIQEWLNINKILVNLGLVHLTDKFLPILQSNLLEEEFTGGYSLELWLENMDTLLTNVANSVKNDNTLLNNSISEEYFGELDLNDEITEIKSWLPPKPIEKSLFLAIATYVDNNCIIYLHDVEQNNYLEQIRFVINKKFASTEDGDKKADADADNKEESSTTMVVWKKNMPCLVKYHLDNKWYRGLVLSTKKKVIQVQFIDYGNVEDCTADELKKDVIMGDIPIQASKYALSNVAPVSGLWHRDKLDFVHASVVDKLCSIRVVQNEFSNLEDKSIVSCHVKVGAIDIGQLLINEKICIERFKQTDAMSIVSGIEQQIADITISDSIVDDVKIAECGSSRRPTTPKKHVAHELYQSLRKPKLDLDDYRHLFKQEAIADFLNDVEEQRNLKRGDGFTDEEDEFQYKVSFNERNDETLFEDEDDVVFDSSSVEVDLETKFIQDENKKSMEADLEKVEIVKETPIFEPLDTSSVVTNEISDYFTNIKLDKMYTTFRGKALHIANAVCVWIVPSIGIYEAAFQKMMMDIQVLVKQHKLQPNGITIGMPCLALYKEDKLYYRATVHKYDVVTDQATVIYVDYMNSEVIPANFIRRCPNSIRKQPIRNVLVKLSGVRENPRLREIDIIRKLGELLEDRVIYIKVVKYAEVLEVQLFSAIDTDEVVYQEMINEGFYRKNKTEDV